MSEHRWHFVRHRQSLVDQSPTTDCYVQPLFHSERHMVKKLLGLSVTADPKGSNSKWQKWITTRY